MPSKTIESLNIDIPAAIKSATESTHNIQDLFYNAEPVELSNIQNYDVDATVLERAPVYVDLSNVPYTTRFKRFIDALLLSPSYALEFNKSYTYDKTNQRFYIFDIVTLPHLLELLNRESPAHTDRARYNLVKINKDSKVYAGGNKIKKDTLEQRLNLDIKHIFISLAHNITEVVKYLQLEQDYVTFSTDFGQVLLILNTTSNQQVPDVIEFKNVVRLY